MRRCERRCDEAETGLKVLLLACTMNGLSVRVVLSDSSFEYIVSSKGGKGSALMERWSSELGLKFTNSF